MTSVFLQSWLGPWSQVQHKVSLQRQGALCPEKAECKPGLFPSLIPFLFFARMNRTPARWANMNMLWRVY